MLLIAQNHLQLIVEVAIMLFVIWVFTLNLIPLSLSVVTFLSLFLMGGFTLLFGADIALLVISSSQAEFTHPFGPLALLGTVAAFASLKVMKESGVDIRPLRRFVILFTIGITVFGGLMHRSFLILWILGLFLGYLIISKSFREKTVLTGKRILMFAGAAVLGLISLETLASFNSRTCIRNTCVRGKNMEQPEEYAKLIKKADPDYVEIKAYMCVGSSRERLTLDNMPTFDEVTEFAKKI